MKKRSVLVLVAVSIVTALVLLTYQQARSNFKQATPTPMLGIATPGAAPTSEEPLEGLVPTPSITTDFAPEIPTDWKAGVLVRHVDGTYEMLLVAPETTLAEIEQKLLSTDSIIASIPPAAMMGHRPPEFQPDQQSQSKSGRPHNPKNPAPTGPTRLPRPTAVSP